MDQDPGAAAVNEWVNVIRRARLDRNTKLVALLLASYADADGTNVFPGVARLAVNADLGYRTVQRILARLRANGWIEPQSRRGARRGSSTRYRLTLPGDLLDRTDVPNPDTEKAAVEQLRQRYRGHHRPLSTSARHPDGTQTTPEHTESARHPDGTQTADCTPNPDPTARHPDGTPPSTETSPLPDPPPDEEDLRTEPKVVDDRTPVDNPDDASADCTPDPAGTAPPAGTTDPDRCPHCRGWLRPTGGCLMPGCPNYSPPAHQPLRSPA